MTFEDAILLILRDLKTNLCKDNQKRLESVLYIKVYAKELLKNVFFVYVEMSDARLLYQSPLKPLTHQRDFDLKCTQDILHFHIT